MNCPLCNTKLMSSFSDGFYHCRKEVFTGKYSSVSQYMIDKKIYERYVVEFDSGIWELLFAFPNRGISICNYLDPSLNKTSLYNMSRPGFKNEEDLIKFIKNILLLK